MSGMKNLFWDPGELRNRCGIIVLAIKGMVRLVTGVYLASHLHFGSCKSIKCPKCPHGFEPDSRLQNTVLNDYIHGGIMTYLFIKGSAGYMSQLFLGDVVQCRLVVKL